VETSVLFSTPEKIVIYVALGLCGLAIMFLALQMQRRVVYASSALSSLDALNREWESAQSSFLEIAGVARQKIGDLESAPAPNPQQSGSVGFDLRNQITSMAKRGMTPAAMAQATGLDEAEVEVLVSLSRLATTRK